MSFLTIPVLNEKQIKNFSSKINKTDSCHIWTGATNRGKEGYGDFRIFGQIFRAHRVAFFIANGFIDNELEIDHTCVEPSCVNEKHLEQVTGAENLRRKQERILARKAA